MCLQLRWWYSLMNPPLKIEILKHTAFNEHNKLDQPNLNGLKTPYGKARS